MERQQTPTAGARKYGQTAKVAGYKQTPQEIIKVLELFRRNKLSYLLFKCEHIFAGEDKNLDVLFETEPDYRKAAWLLRKEGFRLQLSERTEKYKQMYSGWVDRRLVSVHLHREIAWHGIKALDKKWVFHRKKIVRLHPLIVLPSLEDSILIHAAHVLFETFRITGKEKKYFEIIGDLGGHFGVDKRYIKKQLVINRWEKGFQEVIKSHRECSGECFRKGPGKREETGKGEIGKTNIILSLLPKLIHEPETLLYLQIKLIKALLRPLSRKRKGCLISLIGVNGTGKSTLSRKVLAELQPSLRHLGMKGEYYYYGWQPAFFLTKILSRFLSREKIYHQLALTGRREEENGEKEEKEEREERGEKEEKEKEKEQKKKTDLFQEAMFAYCFLEFYYRYLAHLRPRLQKNNLVITDRYFYDLFGQYPYASQSWLMKPLLRIFPKPDRTFLLDAEVGELIKRGKTDKSLPGISAKERKVFPEEYLQKQKENYHCLARYLSRFIKLKRVDTGQSLDSSRQEIVRESGRALL